MRDSKQIDNTRLRAELFFVHRELSNAAATHCKSMLDDLEGEMAGPSVLIWRSLYADCLRVVYCAAMADGEIYNYELGRIRDLLVTAAQHYTVMRNTSRGGNVIDSPSPRAFLERYAHDNGPFGYGAAVRWRGYTLCIRAEKAGHREALDRYARLMRWLLDEACRVCEVDPANPQSCVRLSDIEELRRALTNAGFGPDVNVDRRVHVFLSGTRVFTQVQQALSIYQADPFDVEVMHSDARTSFRHLLRQATTESSDTSSGRTLLLIGGSGAGKTHLLRSFWSHAQESGRGFVAYAEMYPNVDDYTRFFLLHLIESLKCSYSGPQGGRTGLHELAIGIAQLKGAEFVMKVERLAELHGGPPNVLDAQVNQLVDELLGHAALEKFDPDILRVLLYALCSDPKRTARVFQYLRCDSMNEHDRSLIGNIAPRIAKEDPKAMICQLARLAFVTRGAAVVLMIDQMELSGLDSSQAMVVFQRAIDALIGIASEVHSTIVVIACLSNLYEKTLKVLGSSIVDRLEKDPAPSVLSSNLSFDEIKAIVGHRLAWMFAERGAAYRSADPVYPIPEAQLRNLVNRRPRDILEWCHQFHERCIAAGKVIESDKPERPESPPGPPPPPPPEPPIERIAAAWEEACKASRVGTSVADEQVLALVASAARAYAAETGASLTLSDPEDNLLRLRLSTKAKETDLLIGVTSRGPQAGAFGGQIRKLRQAAHGAIAIAVRTEEFPTGAMSIKAVQDLSKAGGRPIVLDKEALRALIAHGEFQPSFAGEHVDAWRRTKRPISSLEAIATMFCADQSRSDSVPGGKRHDSASDAEGDATANGTVPPPSTAGAPRRGRRADQHPRAASR